MIGSDTLFNILGIKKSGIAKIANDIGINREQLLYYNDSNKIPHGKDLELICNFYKISPISLKLKMGYIDSQIIELLVQHSDEIANLLPSASPKVQKLKINPNFTTKYGELYKSDCIDFLQTVDDCTYNLIFADPPFNLNKLYPSEIDDLLKEEEYILWQERWVSECIRVLKPGGAFFLWNLPKWNSYLTSFLNSHLTFRHWISVDIKYSLPIASRLYPSHYSLLYYIKGNKPNTFHPDRLPMEICPNCLADLRDYGGYKDKMNPLGVNLCDVWYDIPPVRHSKYKRRKGANELSLKLLDRIIEMASDEEDIIFDPFGGSGTTYIVSELKKRRWIGTEIGPITDITTRFSLIETEREYLNIIRSNLNCLFTNKVLKVRQKKGLWTPESVRKKNEYSNTLFEL